MGRKETNTRVSETHSQHTSHKPEILFSSGICSESAEKMGLDIGTKDLVTYIPLVTSIGLGIYVTWQALRPKIGLVNPNIEKENPKVVNMMDVEDIGDKIAFCRCWRSKKFPLCDGAHAAHNKKTGDNVGPICLKRREAAS